MPVENGESPHDGGTMVTNKRASNETTALSVDKASGKQGSVTTNEGCSPRPVGRAIVRLADDPSLKTINLEAALPPAVSVSSTTVSTTVASSSSTTTSDNCKLFVGALPYFMTEQELYPLFAKFGTIKELSVQRDKVGRSRGCAWLRYSSVTECEACIRGLHNHYWLGSMKRPLQVQFATSPHHSTTLMHSEGQQQQQYHHPDGKDDDLGIPAKKRVFVGGLPKDVDEHDLLSMIQPVQGDVVCDVKVVRKNGSSDGAAFVEFITPEQAQDFMKMYGSGHQATLRGRPIVLRLDWPKPQVPPPHPTFKPRATAEQDGTVSKENPGSQSIDAIAATTGSSTSKGSISSPIASTTASQSPRKEEGSLASLSAAVAAATVAAMKSSGSMSEANLASIIAAATAAATATAKQRAAAAESITNTAEDDTGVTHRQPKISTMAAAAAAAAFQLDSGRRGRVEKSSEVAEAAAASGKSGQPTRHYPMEAGLDAFNSTCAKSDPQPESEDGPSRTLFISGLPISFALQDVVEMFKLFGPMRDVQLVAFPPGCAVVTFDSEQDAERARVTCDNFTFEHTGRSLSVRPMTDSPPDPYEMLNRGYSGRHYTQLNDPAAMGGGRRMRAYPEGADLFVLRIPATTVDAEIAKVFSEFGQVNSVRALPSRKLGIVSFSTVEEAVNAMTIVNMRVSTGDYRVPLTWLAAGVQCEVENSSHDESDTSERPFRGYAPLSNYQTALGRTSSLDQQQPFPSSQASNSDENSAPYWTASGGAPTIHRDAYSS
ncbi:hypothetical protein FOZ60_014217 [Perkinsus olseni]|uniref:RRM domain-containing protein n=3 Tax=Perkinsus olseni TaxID=32597 RepID=A0A7J6P7Q4_PEROL|nr:hypothetical protein FOZ60_014217 [Perkinsus olseni]